MRILVWNGYGLFQRLKADPLTRHIPVVFLTADRQVQDGAPQLGADACLKKPLKVDRLLEVVALLTIGAKPRGMRAEQAALPRN